MARLARVPQLSRTSESSGLDRSKYWPGAAFGCLESARSTDIWNRFSAGTIRPALNNGTSEVL